MFVPAHTIWLLSDKDIDTRVSMGETTIDCDKRIVDSLIGIDAEILLTSLKPRGTRFIIGDDAYIGL